MANWLTSTCFLIFVFSYFSNAQRQGQYDYYYESLEMRLNSLNSTLSNHQKQIDIIAADLIAHELIHYDDMKKITARMKQAEEKLDSLSKLSIENAEAIATTNLQLVAAELLLLEQTSRIDKLNSSNQIWRSNFQVVNRTFAELKKKLTFVVPVVRGGTATIVV